MDLILIIIIIIKYIHNVDYVNIRLIVYFPWMLLGMILMLMLIVIIIKRNSYRNVNKIYCIKIL